MNSTQTIRDQLNHLLTPTQRGVPGLTEQLLTAHPGVNVHFERIGDQCVSQWIEGGVSEEISSPIPPAAFRTILAHVAHLCNMQSDKSVSPYGSEGQLFLNGHKVSIRFINTTHKQSLDVNAVLCEDTDDE